MSDAKIGIVKEIHKLARINFPRRHVTIKGLHDLYQADLIFMTQHSKENSGYKYILAIICVFSKKAYLIPLKTKTSSEIAQAFDNFFKNHTPPKFVQSDAGGEFFGKSSKVFKKYGIKHYCSYSTKKASVVERFIRTIKQWIYRKFSEQGHYRWLNFIDKLLDFYNSKIHRTIGIAPNSVNKSNEKKILDKIIRDRLAADKLEEKVRNKLKVGDMVRISRHRGIFEKAYLGNWTPELFVIDKIEKTSPVTYKLRDVYNEKILGGFYKHEISKTSFKDIYLVEKILKKKDDKVFVKYLGFNNKFNEWIPAKNIV